MSYSAYWRSWRSDWSTAYLYGRDPKWDSTDPLAYDELLRGQNRKEGSEELDETMKRGRYFDELFFLVLVSWQHDFSFLDLFQ